MSPMTVVGLLLFAAIGVWHFWPSISRLGTLVTRTAVAADPEKVATDRDMAEFAGLTLVQKRFERNKCPEGIAAVQKCLECFYRKPAVPPAEVQS